MRKLLAAIIAACIILYPMSAWAAVAYGSVATANRATSTGFTTASITVSGTNPVLVVHMGLEASTGQTVSAVSWSLGGTGVLVKVIQAGGSNAREETWCIPAPVGGSGTASATFSASVAYQYGVILYTGADQTTPCPTGDAVSDTAITTATTLTPTNLTANDGSSAGCASDLADNPTSVTPNQRSLDSSTAVNLETGDNFGTTGVTCNWDNNVGRRGLVAIRIAAAGSGPPPPVKAPVRIVF